MKSVPKQMPKDVMPERHAALTVNAPQFLVDGSDLGFRQFVHDALAFA